MSSAADPDVGMTVNLIRVWVRGDSQVQEVVMSGSSGPKDYIRNQIASIFDRFPGVERILMVRGEYSEIGPKKRISVPFLLCVNAQREIFDMAGELVRLNPLRGA